MKTRGSILVSAVYALIAIVLIAIVILGIAGYSALFKRAAKEGVQYTETTTAVPQDSAEPVQLTTDYSDGDPDEPTESEPAEPSLSRLEQTAVTQIGELIDLLGQSNGKLYEKIGSYDVGSGKHGLIWNGYRGEGSTSEYDERCFRTCWLTEDNKVQGFIWESVEAGALHDSPWHKRYPHPSAIVLIDNLELKILGVYVHTYRGLGGPICEVGLECQTPNGKILTLYTFADGEPYEERIDLKTNAKIPGSLKPNQLNSMWVYAASGGLPGFNTLPNFYDRDWTKID